MTVMVTGAAGHVGGNLVRALLEQGRDVRALVRSDRRALDGLAVEQVEGDVLDPPSLSAACAGMDVVYHLAVKISIQPEEGPQVMQVNVDGTRNVLAACRAAGVRRLVYFSSIHALASTPRDQVFDEDSPLTAPDFPLAYDRSKGEALRLVRAAVADGMDAVILNPTGIIGPLDFKPSHTGQVLLDLYHGRLPSLVGGGFNWVDVRDVVAGALAAEKLAPAGAQYMLSGAWASIVELGRLAEQATGRRAPRLTSPMWLARVGAPVLGAWARLRGTRPLYTAESLHALRNHRRVSHARATAAFDYQPRPLAETIADCYDWFRANGRL